MFQTPVLLLIFNRPETTNSVFEVIKRVQPAKLYIAADGPRNEAETILCNASRKLTEDIHWDCKVSRLYRDTNLGCKKAVVQGIDWFFEQEEMGIILEDDCVPNETFFDFCSTMLVNYKDEKNVKSVSGSNFLFGARNNTDDYFFINYTLIWGWATWKRAWNEIDWNRPFEAADIADKIRKSYSNKQFRKWISNLILHYNLNFEKTWDVHVLTTFLLNNGLSIIPSKNLITNIGAEGTHDFKEVKSINASTEDIVVKNLPAKKNAEISRSIQDLFMQNVAYIYLPVETTGNKIKRKIRQYFRFLQEL